MYGTILLSKLQQLSAYNDNMIINTFIGLWETEHKTECLCVITSSRHIAAAYCERNWVKWEKLTRIFLTAKYISTC